MTQTGPSARSSEMEGGSRSTPAETVNSRCATAGQRRVRVRAHPNRRVQAAVEQVREAEMVQAIDRLRLIHSPREKTVVILCNIALDIPVDELLTWRELAGDGRLLKALEICEENGWEALPLAAKELTRLFPGALGYRKSGGELAAQEPSKVIQVKTP